MKTAFHLLTLYIHTTDYLSFFSEVHSIKVCGLRYTRYSYVAERLLKRLLQRLLNLALMQFSHIKDLLCCNT